MVGCVLGCMPVLFLFLFLFIVDELFVANTIASWITCSKLSVPELSHMDCLSYCRKGSASPQFAQSAQWYWQRYCIDLIYPILLLAVKPFALFAEVLPAVYSRWCFATAVFPAVSSRWCSCQHLRHGAPASNKPHQAEKSTPVWLAIWRTWAGFANSQHRDAALATPDNICAHSSLLPH